MDAFKSAAVDAGLVVPNVVQGGILSNGGSAAPTSSSGSQNIVRIGIVGAVLGGLVVLLS